MKGISKEDWNMLMRELQVKKSVYRDVAYIQIRSDIFVELNFNKSKNCFGIDILEGVYYDNNKCTGNGVLGYSSGYTPNLLPTVVKLVKKYISDTDFQELLKNEYKTNKNFSDYFSKETGIPHRDLVVY